MNHIKTITLLCLLSNTSFSQIDVRKFDYAKIDSIAINYQPNKSESYKIISKELVKGLNTEHEKCRVIFRWIAENIEYSYSAKSTKPEYVIKNRKAVCSGYSALFKAMCDEVGLNAIIINGFAKTEVKYIGKKFKESNHAWNAVNLYNKWYLIDATWAWGYYLIGTKKMIKEYRETYFLTLPEIFFSKHFPDKRKHFFGEKMMSKTKFINSPIFYEGFYNAKINAFSPENGSIKLNLKDTLELSIKSHQNINRITLGISGQPYSIRPIIKKVEKEGYILKHKFHKKGYYNLTIFVNGEGVLAYKINVKTKS